LHKYLRAIGFSTLTEKTRLKDVLTDTIMNSDERNYTTNEEKIMLGEFCKDFADGVGIAVCGEFDEEDKFIYEFYFPYLRGTGITATEDVSVERHLEKESYAGVCDSTKVGVCLIFYLRNRIPYIKALTTDQLPMKGTTVTLSALSLGGTVLIPLQKDEEQQDLLRKRSNTRTRLLEEARKGSEKAMETLALEDMDTYTSISNRIQKEDVLSIVDTYFMPYGVESDVYSILGEITDVKLVTNHVTGEKVYILGICCNELTFDVCINIIDLLGEPQIGRRFKGSIWLQGYINFPEEI